MEQPTALHGTVFITFNSTYIQQNLLSVSFLMIYITYKQPVFLHTKHFEWVTLEIAADKMWRCKPSLWMKKLFYIYAYFTIIFKCKNKKKWHLKNFLLSLKIMKKPFCFTLKALFLLKVFKVVLTFWSCRKTAWLKR